jgi:hypothetical protein
MIRRGVAVLAVTFAALLSGRASAQYNPQPYNPQFGVYNPQYQSNLSPYLNILRGNAAVNYYGATLGRIPSFQQNLFNTQVGASLFDLQRRQAQGNVPPEEMALLPGTGHPTAFGYYAPYYNFVPPQRIPPQAAPPTSTGAKRSARQ